MCGSLVSPAVTPINSIPTNENAAIWNDKKEELFMARDHFGIKPLYYSFFNENFVFASEVKAILNHPECKAILDKTGISELLGIGPSHTQGICPFKGIKELEPAHAIIYNKNYFKIKSNLLYYIKNVRLKQKRSKKNIRYRTIYQL